MKRILWVAFAVFVWTLKLAFWLPMLTISIYDLYNVRNVQTVLEESLPVLFSVFVGWCMAGFILLFMAASSMPWIHTIIVVAAIHYMMGIVVLRELRPVLLVRLA